MKTGRIRAGGGWGYPGVAVEPGAASLLEYVSIIPATWSATVDMVNVIFLLPPVKKISNLFAFTGQQDTRSLHCRKAVLTLSLSMTTGALTTSTLCESRTSGWSVE